MLYKGFVFCLILALCSCADPSESNATITAQPKILQPNNEATLKDIAAPEGYSRSLVEAGSFASYLRLLPLKKDKRVYLYNGSLKQNQAAQYAVVNISVGEKDLQQCADAVMRLRAEYFYALKKYSAIEFFTGTQKPLNYAVWLAGKPASRPSFDAYLNHVFNWCGTASLPYSVKQKPLHKMQIGDILLKPGSPGHTVMVVDMATNNAGKKLYLLAQSYMPAQDIHVLKDFENKNISPWYELNDNEEINTPEWKFYKNQLYQWK